MPYLTIICKRSLFIVACWLLSNPLVHAYDFNYSENFETSDPFRPWASNGTYTVNFKGLEQDVPLLGNRYFKLDITLDTASYAYFYIPLSPIPSARGKLNFSGKIHVKEAEGHGSASLGTNVSLSPSPISGVNIIERLSQPSTAWVTQTSDLIAAARMPQALADYGATDKDTGFWTDKVGLYVFGSPGDRIEVYIDELSIKGAVDDPKPYKKSTTEAWASHLVRMESVNSENQSKIDTLKQYLAKASPEKVQLLAGAESAFSEVLHNFKGALKTPARSLQKVSDHWQVLDGLLEDDSSAENIVIFPWPATKKLPNGPRPKDKNMDPLSVRMARGTFEAASFVIRATHRGVSNVAIQPTDLVAADGGVISASNIDIRVVKRWYQSNDGQVNYTPDKHHLSELLLKDDSLVRVDAAAQTNALRVTLPNAPQSYIDITAPAATFPGEASISDAKTLQPFNLVPHYNQQIWLTFHVPDNAKLGLYKGALNIRDADGHANTVNLSLTVLPFTLSQSRLEYGIYYSSVLSKGDKPGFSNAKSSAQIMAELTNMRDHGIKYPTVYEPLANLEKRLTMMKSAGLPTDRLYELGNSGIHLSSSTPEEIQKFKHVAGSVMKVAAKNAFSNVHFYGVDEASLAVLAQERPFFEAVHQLGAKVFTAVNSKASTVDSIAAAGNLLDAPVLAGERTAEEIAAWRSHGASQVFLYANPQVGVEDPEIYRKNFGLGMFAAGYDGAMNFAYQFPFGATWNDFDDPKKRYRDHMFTYPTSDGVIDTVQWEGFREGIDDTRYLATLLDLDPNRTEAEMRAWATSLLGKNRDVAAIRELLIDEILKVLANKKPANPAG
ncbi:hypothetical protein [Methylobacter svalbardensis]|uniref:hypothetical protein n=1 Tax=Methylobacter svalbardensis TaxID=3080016 RepID=UPI0030EBC9E5